MRLTYLALAAVVISMDSCSSTQLMSLSVQQPAPVTLPEGTQRVGIVNRTFVARQNKVLDVTDKIFSLEGPGLDLAGAAASVDGLSQGLSRDSRFTSVRILSDHLTTLNPAQFPTPLGWDAVTAICRDNNVDVLFSLELFDSDSKISYSMAPVKVNTPLGSVPMVEHQATMLTTVNSGWRIYDPASREVVDEFASAENISYAAKGINPVVAAGGLIGRKEAVKEVGNKSGEAYSARIVPYWIRVARDYYVRGSDRFTVAKRKAQTGNWDDAAVLWKEETTNAKGKVAGRACYNMAIINEINGHLDEAITWAQRAYEDHNNRLALRYVNVLKHRQQENNILTHQQSQIAGVQP